jgi:hypothetical protein
MDSEINFVKKNVKKHGKKFSLFLFIGILKAILLIALNWLVLDILHVWALLGSTIVIVTIFFVTYFAYVITKVIKPSFSKYTSATVVFNITTILLIWFFVDFIGFSGALSSAIVVGFLFILRYIFFNKIGLIQYG